MLGTSEADCFRPSGAPGTAVPSTDTGPEAEGPVLLPALSPCVSLWRGVRGLPVPPRAAALEEHRALRKWEVRAEEREQLLTRGESLPSHTVHSDSSPSVLSFSYCTGLSLFVNKICTIPIGEKLERDHWHPLIKVASSEEVVSSLLLWSHQGQGYSWTSLIPRVPGLLQALPSQVFKEGPPFFLFLFPVAPWRQLGCP